MPETEHLITTLSQDAARQPVRLLAPPRVWGLRLMVILGGYLLGGQAVLGLRPDLAAQLHRPFFVAEILLLAALCGSSAHAAVYALYPDGYQRSSLARVPLGVCGLLIAVLAVQFGLPPDAGMVLPAGAGVHEMECALCIAAVAMLPAGVLFTLLHRGATVQPLRAGGLAVLCAAAIGCLTLRLAEMNDSLSHVIQWHYVPTLLFAALGAGAGKFLLKW